MEAFSRTKWATFWKSPSICTDFSKWCASASTRNEDRYGFLALREGLPLTQEVTRPSVKNTVWRFRR